MSLTKKILSGAVLLNTLAASVVYAKDYDLVVNNGRVMDPVTLYDDVSNVGIKDGRVVAISKDALEGTETVDATGHIVAPGFIDTHFYLQTPIGCRVGFRDGLTSGMAFEASCRFRVFNTERDSPETHLLQRRYLE